METNPGAPHHVNFNSPEFGKSYSHCEFLVFYYRITCMDKHPRLNVDKVRPDSHSTQFPPRVDAREFGTFEILLCILRAPTGQ
jgi:hypothetical protein